MKFDIPGPEDLAEETRRELEPKIEAAVKRIIAKLKQQKYAGGSATVYLETGEIELEKHLVEVFESTRKWKVEVQHDGTGRDGTRLILSPARVMRCERGGPDDR